MKALRQEHCRAAKVFLAHAGVCPDRVKLAVTNTQLATQGIEEAVLPVTQFQRARDLAARLLCTTGRDRVCRPTSLALSYVAGGLKFSVRNVLVYLVRTTPRTFIDGWLRSPDQSQRLESSQSLAAFV